MKQSSLKINEIFYSIQGEASQSGMPCVFVRLSGCPLRCRWCDTEYAFHEGERLGFEQILEKIKSYGCRLVEITGGEPLAQPACLPFMELLEKEGFDLMLETSGAYCVKNVPSKVKIIMDLKAPGSGEQNKNRYENLQYLCPEKDELKIVVSDRGDFEYACDLWSRPEMKKFPYVWLSPSFGELSLDRLTTWILDSKKRFRLQTQLHKHIWHPQKRGV